MARLTYVNLSLMLSLGHPMDEAAHLLALVRKAICSGLSNCVGWVSDDLQRRVLSDPGLQGLTPREVKRLLIEWIKDHGGELFQRPERPDRIHQRDYFYFTLVPVTGLVRDLYVKMELTDDDDDCPVVTILSVHLELL